jgi:rod shape determining protein RodA|tara:strand:- start:9733 stop:10878 length:1146 start_codon:yes stop_codon:yes gene_type:complete
MPTNLLKDPIRKISGSIDWILFSAATLLVLAGLVTMNSFVDPNSFFEKQIIWAIVGTAAFFSLSFIDFRFLRRTGVIVSLFAVSALILFLLLIFGDFVKGAQNRFDLGIFSLQPSDPVKLVVILLLAKYFSRRHVEIAHIRHILVSGFYAFVLFLLVFLQPDFGSAIIIALIWFGMVLVSGISKKHLLIVFFASAIAFAGLWIYAFEDYQRERIQTFVHPLTDLQGAGYNAYQSTIAVGSGQILGKGIGYGTQSKLQFLPEYETDFIFAAFAEEWGFVGVVMILLLYGIVIWRIIANAIYGATNFEILFGIGLAILFMSHFIVHVGMNIGLLPITGTTVPFLSYGGSHLITEFVGLGILMGMRRYRRAAHKDDIKKEFLGV